MRKKNALVRVCVWTGVTMLLIVALLTGIGVAGPISFMSNSNSRRESTVSYAYSDADAYVVGGTEVPAAGIQEVQVHWVSGEVSMEVYDGDTITFFETAGRALDDDEQLRYRVDNGRLTIQFCQSSLGINSLRMPSKSLTLRLPQSIALRLLDIENVSSYVKLSGGGLQVNTLDIENVSGTINVQDISAKEFSLESVSGTVNIHGAFDTIRADNVSGSQSYRLAKTPEEMRVDSISGGVTVRLPGERGFTAKVDAISGKLTTDFATMTEKNKKAVYGDGSAELRFDSVSGGVSLLLDTSLTIVPTPKPVTAKESPLPVEATTEKGDPIPSSQRAF